MAAIDTRLTELGRPASGDGRPVNVPAYRASTFVFDSLAAFETAGRTPFDVPFYGRVGTPTVNALEEAVAALEGAHRAIATPSGLAAISATFLAFAGAGDHVLIVDSVYDPVRRFATRMLGARGVDVTYYPADIGAGIAGLIRPTTKLVYLESPGSGTFEMQDVPAIAAAARAAGVVTAIDNTWATPVLFRPLEHGVDVSIQSGTKYLVGHSDAMLGVVGMTEATYPALRQSCQDLGLTAGSEECYLALRGLRTLAVRLRRHERTALALAAALRGRPEVAAVLHPGLPGAPGHDLWARDIGGASGLFAVELMPYSPAALARMIDGFHIFRLGFSWGGFESLVLPMHPERSRTARPWTGGPVMRFHAGLEDVDDLLVDLIAGLDRLAEPV
jgi:cystathionine beta-lyase